MKRDASRPAGKAQVACRQGEKSERERGRVNDVVRFCAWSIAFVHARRHAHAPTQQALALPGRAPRNGRRKREGEGIVYLRAFAIFFHHHLLLH